MHQEKIIESFKLSDWEIQTDTGWQDLSYVHKTIPFKTWKISTKNFTLECADTHIVFDENYNEIFIKDLTIGDGIITQNGAEEIVSIMETDQMENMYDVSVESEHQRYYSNGILSHNTTTLIAYILWATIFNDHYKVAILANKGSLAREILSRYQLAYENLPPYLQQGVVEFNKGSVELENGSKIIAAATSSSSVRGTSQNFLLIDEAGFIPNNLINDFLSSVFPTLSSGQNTKLVMASTPKGCNMFYKYWTDAVAGRNGFVPFEVHWSQVPGRDEAWKDDMVLTQGIEKFRQEFECEFLGSTNTLVSGEKLACLAYGVPLKNYMDAIIYEEPIKDGIDDENDKVIAAHTYVLCADVSEGKNLDYSAFCIFDVSVMPYKQVAIYRSNSIPPILYPTVIKAIAEYYNEAYVLVEINNNPQVADLLIEDLGYDNVFRVSSGNKHKQSITLAWGRSVANGVRMSPLVKRLGCSMLKTLIESDKLILMDFETISEMTTFVQNGPTYKAEEGAHDDLAMCLVMFSWLTTQKLFKEMQEKDLRKMLQSENFEIPDEEIMPIIEMTNGQEEERFYADGDLWLVGGYQEFMM